MQIIDYITISARLLEQVRGNNLEDLVMQYIAAGYEPFGSPVVFSLNGELRALQAMVKVKNGNRREN